MGDPDDLMVRWLAHLEQELGAAGVDAARRERIVSELDDHLHCHADAARARGVARDEAVAEACRSCGDPAIVARAFAAGPAPARRVATASVNRGLAAGFVALTPAVLVWIAAFVSPLGGVEDPAHFLTSLGAVAEWVAFVASPLLAVVVGARVNQRAHSVASRVLVVAGLALLAMGAFAFTALRA